MNNPKNLSAGIVKDVQELKEQLKEFIKSLPDANDGVTKLGKNCGTVSLSTIMKNNAILCPSYYLNNDAKEAFLNLLDKTGIENLSKRIEETIKTGVLVIYDPKGYHHNHIRLHPEFVAELKRKWFGEPLNSNQGAV